MLYNSEVWFGVTNKEIEKLEQVDEMILRSVLSLPRSTPRPFLYLELGCLPIRYILITRRLMFLHYILNEDEHSLLHQVFQAQLSSPLKGDWISDIMNDLNTLKLIHLTFEDIHKMTKPQFKKIVNDAVNTEGLIYLTNLQLRMRKFSHIEYKSLEMQNYLYNENFSNIQAEFLCSVRGRMLDVKNNYRGTNQDITCPTCSDPAMLDTQQHLLLCDKLEVNTLTLTRDLFSVIR